MEAETQLEFSVNENSIPDPIWEPGTHDVPRVSIGMPVWNCERTIASAIQSILAQTYHNWELLIMDDGSTDSTLKIARSYKDPRIKIYSDGSHKKISARLNESILQSSGTYFARMDGDDVAYPDRLEKQLSYIREHEGIDVVGATMLVFSGDYLPRGKRQAPESHAIICRDPVNGFAMAHPTWLGRLSWFRRHLYVNEMSLIEDQDLLLRTYQYSRFANVPTILMGYREDNLNFARNLRGRMMLVRRLTAEFLEQGRWTTAMRAGIVQVLKAAVYSVCACPGLRKRLLSHRAGAELTPAELDNWRKVTQFLAA